MLTRVRQYGGSGPECPCAGWSESNTWLELIVSQLSKIKLLCVFSDINVNVLSCPYPGDMVIRGTSGVDKEAEWSLGERTRGDNLREGKRLEDQVGPD